MLNFVFHNPTRIVFGKGELAKLGQEVKAFGSTALLVTGRGSARRTGALDRAVASLEGAGIKVHMLEGVRSNPVLSRVREGIERSLSTGVDVVVALGGGSVMDTAKAIAAGVLLKGADIWDVFLGKAVIESALPVITCPTLAASGSEMNGYMVITDEKSCHKLATGSPHVYPKVSVLDPELTYTVSKDYTAYGGVDAVCHLMESFFNGLSDYTPIQDGIAGALMRAIMDATKGAIEDPMSYDHRSTLMWGATLALNGITKAGVGDHHFPVHLIEHAVSAIFDVPHGAGLSALLPGWMTFFTGKRPDRMARFARSVMCVGIGSNDEDAAQAGIEAFTAWLRSIQCPVRLGELGIHEEDLERISENALFQSRLWGMEQEYGKETIEKVLRLAI